MPKLSDVCIKGTSNVAQKDLDARNGAYPIYGASGFIKNVDFYHQEKPYIAIVKDGAGVGRVMQLPAKSSVIGTMQYIIPNEGVSVEYLAYALEHMNLSKYYLGAAIPHIYFKDYCGEILPNHTPEEQAHISHVLGLVSNLIFLRKQQLSKLDELVKSRFVELFGHQSHNEKNMSYGKIDDVAEIYLGLTHTPTYVEDGVKFISAKNTSCDYLDLSDVKYISREEFEKAPKGTKPQIGDVLFSRVGSNLGHPVILDVAEELCTFVSLGFLRTKGTVTNVYLKHWMRDDFFAEQVAQKVVGGGQPNLNTGWLKEFKIIIPPMSLQNEFTAFVEQTDKSKFEIQKSLEKLETLKKALMQKYFE